MLTSCLKKCEIMHEDHNVRFAVHQRTFPQALYSVAQHCWEFFWESDDLSQIILSLEFLIIIYLQLESWGWDFFLDFRLGTSFWANSHGFVSSIPTAAVDIPCSCEDNKTMKPVPKGLLLDTQRHFHKKMHHMS